MFRAHHHLAGIQKMQLRSFASSIASMSPHEQALLTSWGHSRTLCMSAPSSALPAPRLGCERGSLAKACQRRAIVMWSLHVFVLTKCTKTPPLGVQSDLQLVKTDQSSVSVVKQVVYVQVRG